MKLITLASVLFGVSLSMPTGDIWEQLVIDDFDRIDHVKAFKAWQRRFNKKYGSVTEEGKRMMQFVENWSMINKHNKLFEQGKTTYTMGLNQFADLNVDEFRLYVHGHSGSCVKKGDNVFQISTAPKNKDSVSSESSSSSSESQNAEPIKVDTPAKNEEEQYSDSFDKLFDELMPDISITKNKIDINFAGFDFKFYSNFGRRMGDVNDPPAAIDWTNINGKSYVTPVKNQGQCGSCWAFSTTGSIESRSAIKNNQTGNAVISLSEQQLVDCSRAEGNQGCNGGLMEDAFKYVEKSGGLCTESEYPYTAKDGSCKQTTCGKKYDPITGYKVVTKDSEPALQAAVADGPVSVSVDAAGEAWQFYRGGVVSSHCGILLDHGVLAVGYGHDDSAKMDYWKVKNSWGKTWGEEGYIRLCRNCNQNGDMGECGILRDDSFPTV